MITNTDKFLFRTRFRLLSNWYIFDIVNVAMINMVILSNSDPVVGMGLLFLVFPIIGMTLLMNELVEDDIEN